MKVKPMPDAPPSTQKCAIFRGTAGEEIRFPLAGRDLTEIQALMFRTHAGCEYLGTEQAGIITPRTNDPDELASLFIGAVLLAAVAAGISYYLIEQCQRPIANFAGYPFAVVALIGGVTTLWVLFRVVWRWIAQFGLLRLFILLSALGECALVLYTAANWDYDRSGLTPDTRVSVAGCFVVPLFALAVIYTFRSRNRP